MGWLLNNKNLQDLTQDMLMVVWRKLVALLGEGSLEGWAHKIVMLELLNAMCKKQHGLRSVGPGVTEDEPWCAPAPGLESKQAKTILQHLTLCEAEVMCLKHFEQFLFPEVAELLGFSASTAKTHCHCSVDKLLSILLHEARDPAQKETQL